MYFRFLADQLLNGLMFYVLQDVDEKLLYDTFSAFGVIVANPKVFLNSFLRIDFFCCCCFVCPVILHVESGIMDL